jgi:purine-binding chemotaxis protein CheW
MGQSHLIFCHRGARYGIEVGAVREIVWLPALAPIEELPPHVVGIFNLRGRVVPVIDLGLRFGHLRQPCQVSDRVVVIERGPMLIGIIASSVDDVLDIAPALIEELCCGTVAGLGAQCIRAEAKLEQGLAMLLDIDALLDGHALPGQLPDADALPGCQPALAEGLPCFGSLSADDAQTVRRRALDLAQAGPDRDRAARQAYAVIRLGGELFGLDLNAVSGFAPLRAVAPLPCCPPHVVGNMNLRGEILTLVDIGPALGMAPTPLAALREVVVLQSGALLLGLPAQEIVDVVHLAAPDIAPLPLASSRSGAPCCKGVASIDGHAVALLDLQKMLTALKKMSTAPQKMLTALPDRPELQRKEAMT